LGQKQQKKAKTFAIYFSKIFKLKLRKITLKKENKAAFRCRYCGYTRCFTAKKFFAVKEMQVVIKNMNLKKTDYDFIINRFLNSADAIRNKNEIYHPTLQPSDRAFFHPNRR